MSNPTTNLPDYRLKDMTTIKCKKGGCDKIHMVYNPPGLKAQRCCKCHTFKTINSQFNTFGEMSHYCDNNMICPSMDMCAEPFHDLHPEYKERVKAAKEVENQQKEAIRKELEEEKQQDDFKRKVVEDLAAKDGKKLKAAAKKYEGAKVALFKKDVHDQNTGNIDKINMLQLKSIYINNYSLLKAQATDRLNEFAIKLKESGLDYNGNPNLVNLSKDVARSGNNYTPKKLTETQHQLKAFPIPSSLLDKIRPTSTPAESPSPVINGPPSPRSMSLLEINSFLSAKKVEVQELELLRLTKMKEEKESVLKNLKDTPWSPEEMRAILDVIAIKASATTTFNNDNTSTTSTTTTTTTTTNNQK